MQSCALRTHIHIHTGERHFSYEMCDKKIKISADLRTDMHTYTIFLTQHGTKPCPAALTQ